MHEWKSIYNDKYKRDILEQICSISYKPKGFVNVLANQFGIFFAHDELVANKETYDKIHSVKVVLKQNTQKGGLDVVYMKNGALTLDLYKYFKEIDELKKQLDSDTYKKRTTKNVNNKMMTESNDDDKEEINPLDIKNKLLVLLGQVPEETAKVLLLLLLLLLLSLLLLSLSLSLLSHHYYYHY
jgi:lipopolysaccharide export LptBFGC system permease protein LptF